MSEDDERRRPSTAAIVLAIGILLVSVFLMAAIIR